MQSLLAIKVMTISNIMEAVGVSRTFEVRGAVKVIINASESVSDLQELAIKSNGIREFHGIEDRLIDLMGEDEYDDWADDNGIN